MNRQLAALTQDLEAAQHRLDRLAGETLSRTWNTRPDADRWSPAECIAHLNLSSRAILPVLREGLATARTRQGRTSRYRRDVTGWVISLLVAPSSAVKLKAAASVVPDTEHDVPALLREFAALQAELADCVREAEGLPIDRVTVTSPFDPRISYNLYAALTLVARHQHRHLLQAERAVEVPLPLVSAFAV